MPASLKRITKTLRRIGGSGSASSPAHALTPQVSGSLNPGHVPTLSRQGDAPTDGPSHGNPRVKSQELKSDDGKKNSWRSPVIEGMKESIRLVSKASDMFPPLKTASAAIAHIISIVDKAALNKNDFSDMQVKLKNLSAILDGLQGENPPASLRHLCNDFSENIIRIRDSIAAHQDHSLPRRLAESDKNTDTVMRLFREIGYEIDKFQVQISIQIYADLNNNRFLQELRPEGVEDKVQRQTCMEGTRLDTLENVDKWVDDPAARHILWITGYPGTGKSALAMSIVEKLGERNLLGSAFFFERDNAKQKTPSALWRQTSFDLAQRLPKYAATVIEKLERGQLFLSKATSTQLFRQLIELPLKSDTISGSTSDSTLVIVIDALDECGGLEGSRSKERKDLLGQLSRCSDLRVKVIVTSREEDDISRTLWGQSHHLRLVAGDSARNSSDIRTYFESEFRSISSSYQSLDVDWPGSDKIRELTESASGLFIWATTAIRIVERGDPIENLEALSSIGGSTYDLYRKILDLAFTDNPSLNIVAIFKAFCGILILAKVPLRLKDICQILDIRSVVTLELIQKGLRPVLDNSSDTMRFSHQSFVDYPCDSSCPKHFSFEKDAQSRHLALSTMKVLRQNLRFNICSFPSSHLQNKEVKDLLQRMQDANITQAVTYSCCFWASHFADSPYASDLLSNIEEFLNKYLLFWIELLSILEKVSTASLSLMQLSQWIEDGDRQISIKLKDARRFLSAFGNLASQSAPHIYMSALPFAPTNSWPSLDFIGKFLRTMEVESGQDNYWSAEETCIEGHTSYVWSVAISPDDKRVVSGSRDKTIRIWDAETGELISEPIEGHESWVNSVAFSHDGKKVVSGSSDKTVRIWNVETGSLILKPFEGHADGVSSVAFSHDSRRVVSGSEDKTICVWDSETGQLVFGPFQGHTDGVFSVVFSPDGKKIASGSNDSTICIWDVETGKLVLEPLKGHTSRVSSVTFSHDGTRIVSGSSDKTVRIWDTATGKLTLDPLEGHTDMVRSVAFSHDDKRIASGSTDKTIRIWDSGTGELVSEPFEGHMYGVRSVAFSHDSKRVVSGANDSTIRIWDVEVGKLVSAPFQGHTLGVRSVSFSDDGKKVVSGSWDQTIRMWDVETGKLVLPPFKGHTSSVWSVAFSHDSKLIVSGSDDNTICIWDAETGELVSGPLKGHSSGVPSVAFSNNGERVASGSVDKTIRIWDPETGTLMSEPFEGHTDVVWTVAFSPDGKSVVSGSNDSTIRIWDVDTGKLVLLPLTGHKLGVWSVAFLHDGKRVVSGSLDKTIRIWDTETGELVSAPFEGHADMVRSVSFSHDGRRVVSGSDDTTICIWDAETGELVSEPITGHMSTVWSVAFSYDGKRVCSGSDDNTVRIWDVEILHRGFLDETAHVCDVETGVPKTADQTGHSEVSKQSSFGAVRGFSPNPEHWLVLDETQDPALTCCSTFDMIDGWVRSPSGERMFWVPQRHRTGLWTRGTKQIMSSRKVVTLDLSKIVHGPDWHKCYTEFPSTATA